MDWEKFALWIIVIALVVLGVFHRAGILEMLEMFKRSPRSNADLGAKPTAPSAATATDWVPRLPRSDHEAVGAYPLHPATGAATNIPA